MPALLFLYPDKDPEVITAVSLIAVLANSASGSIAYGYQRRIDYRSGIPFVIAGLPGAILGAVLAVTSKFVIRVRGQELMPSRVHGSDAAAPGV